MINVGIDPSKAITAVDIFDDAQQTYLDSIDRIDKILFEVQNRVTQAVQTGDGNPVGGVKSADDVHAEQKQENASAV